MSVGKHAGERLKTTLATTASARAKGISVLLRDQGSSDDAFANPEPTNEYEIQRSMHANSALRILGSVGDQAIKRTFEEAKLNPENPWHWRILLELFAEAHYPAKDANRFWSDDRLIEVLEKEFLLTQNGKRSRKNVNNQLRDFIEARFERRVSTVTLRTLLRQAKDPSYNIFIRRAEIEFNADIDHSRKPATPPKQLLVVRALEIYRTELKRARRAIKALPPSVNRL